jgi:hypothetical protein
MCFYWLQMFGTSAGFPEGTSNKVWFWNNTQGDM